MVTLSSVLDISSLDHSNHFPSIAYYLRPTFLCYPFLYMSDPIQGTVLPKFDPKDIADNRIVAAISYLSILFLIPLVFARGSRFAQEHSKQGAILFICWVIGSFCFWIPLFGWLAAVILFVVNAYAFLECLNGKFWEIPYLGKLREKIKL